MSTHPVPSQLSRANFCDLSWKVSTELNKSKLEQETGKGL